MTKRILALLMVLALVLTVLPAGVVAVEETESIPAEAPQQEQTQQEQPVEGEEDPAQVPSLLAEETTTHTDAGHTCEDCKDPTVVWTAWEAADSLPTKGHYYLTQNVVLEETAANPYKVDGELVLCLNGKSVTRKSGTFNILTLDSDDDVLTITDCTASGEGDTYKAGSLGGAFRAIDNNQSSAKGATVNLYDGIITGNNASNNGAGLNISGTFNMYGGKISGNNYTSTATTEKKLGGGAVYLSASGRFNMYGGEISGNTSKRYGGAIYAAGGAQVTITGGKIDNNTAADQGGAIYAASGAVLSIADCQITNNNAKGGAGIRTTDVSYTLTRVTLTGNEITGAGGSAVHVSGQGVVTLVDCTITGNKCTDGTSDHRGTVYMANPYNKLIISGSTVVNNNTAVSGTVERNIFLQVDNASEVFTVEIGTLTEGAQFNVYCRTAQADPNNYLKVQSGVDTAKLDGFRVFDEKNLQYAVYSAAEGKFVFEPVHKHCLCGDSSTANPDCDHTEITWLPWDQADSLPTSGNYYLMTDVTTGGRTDVTGTSTLNLCMHSHTVDGNQKSTILYVNDTAKLNVVDCTGKGKIVNGQHEHVGGAFYAQKQGQLTVMDIEISGNRNTQTSTSTGYSGGAIHARENSVVKLVNVKLTGNSTTAEGGAICIRNSASVIIRDSEISGNHAGRAGGAVYVTGGSLELVNTTVSGNTSATVGGGVYVNSNAVKIAVDGTTVVDGNTVSGSANNLALMGTVAMEVGQMADGAKICVTAENIPRFVSGAVDETEAKYFSADDPVRDITWEEGKLYIDDGAAYAHSHCLCNDPAGEYCGHTAVSWKLWNDPDDLPSTSGCYYLLVDVKLSQQEKLTGSTNVVLCLNGHTVEAAFSEEGVSNDRVYSLSDDAQLVITDCNENPGKLTGSTASAVVFQPSATANARFDLYNGILTDNSGKDGGGAVVVQGKATFNMYGGKITGNESAAYEKVASNGAPTGAGGVGGGVYVGTGATFNMYGGEISNNTAKKVEYKVVENEKEVTKTAGGNGGGIYATGATVQLLGGQICGNTAQTNGGGMYTTGSTVSDLRDITISGNSAKEGGGMYAGGSSITIAEGTLITQNTAAYGGGAVITGKVNAAMSGGKVTGNRATNGAGLAVQSTDTVFTLSGGEISGNIASDKGGGMYLNRYITFTMTGSTVSGNSAKDGAGIYSGGATMTIRDGMIEKNTASGNAGAILLDCYQADDSEERIPSSLSLAGGIIRENKAVNGGAIVAQNKSALTLSGGEITGNTASSSGGAIFVSRNTGLTVTGGKLTGNSANNGGGVYLYEEATLELTGGEITGNTARNLGGGVYAHADTAKLALAGSAVIRDNTAGTDADNLSLRGTLTMELGDMADGQAQIGISVQNLYRFISGEADAADVKYFFADDPIREIIHKEGKLYIGDGSAYAHNHCLCGDPDGKYCDHAAQQWRAWNDPNGLPTTSGYYYLLVDVKLSGQEKLTGSTNVALCLNGHTVEAACSEEGVSNDRVYSLANDVRLTITDCNANPGKLTGSTASAVVFQTSATANARFDLYNGILTGNSGKDGGGAVVVQGKATFNMYGGKITGNESAAYEKVASNGAPTGAGGVGGGVYVGTGATFRMYGGEISNNTAKKVEYKVVENEKEVTKTAGGNGGGVYIVNASFELVGGTISGNTAQTNGGGVMNSGGKTVITMTGGEIADNKAAGVAGGILLQSTGAQMLLKGGTIRKNTANSGGGVYISKKTVFTMEGGTISGNKSLKYDGGGLYLLESEMTMTGGTVSGNVSESTGGGFYLSGATLNLKGGKITGNSTSGNGAAICTVKGAVINMTGGSVSSNKSAKVGGAMLLQSESVLNLKGGTISGNTAKTNGGGVYISHGCTIKMSGGTISKNKAGGSGAGLYLLDADATLSGGKITGNSTQGSCGGVCIAGARVKLCGTSITDNTADGNGGGVMTTSGKYTKGGKEVIKYPQLTITSGTVSGNKAVHGGGILIQTKAVVKMSGGTVENNTATGSGGGIYVSTNTSFTMTGGTVQNNTATKDGGGIYHLKSTGVYEGGTITGNTAGRSAGGLLTTGDTTVVTLKNVSITGNTASNGGGVVTQTYSTLNVEGADISQNTSANHGGAIYLSTNSFLNIVSGTLSGNTAGGRGGAIYTAVTSTPTMSGGVISGNSADLGGGIFCQGNFHITGGQITGNKANSNGGGISTGKMGVAGIGQQPGLVLENASVTENTAGGYGGGVYMNIGSVGTMNGAVITGNVANSGGGGIWAVDDLTMHDLTVTGNASGGEGYAVYLAASNYDGESYFTGVFKVSGVMKIQDNVRGDLYIGEKTTVSIGHEGLAEGSLMQVKLYEGLLTNVLYGAYDYEGNNKIYTVTAGDLSLTNPEYAAPAQEETEPSAPTESTQAAEPSTPTQEEPAGSGLIAVAGGILAVLIAAAAVIIVLVNKKKKASN